MAQVVLFHHVQGLTDGVRAFAEALGAGGHVVHTPDLFDGEQPDSIEAGLAVAARIGDDILARRADEALADLSDDLVYAGISFGVMTAQRLAQTRRGAQGALLYESCLPITGEWAFGPWPQGIPVQIHGMDHDPVFVGDGDLDAARELVTIVGERAELFTYSGDEHLFLDRSLPSYDADATAVVVERSRALLDRIG